MGRPAPHRKQSDTRPEVKRRDSNNTASFTAGLIAGAVAGAMSHRYSSNTNDVTLGHSRGEKQVAWADDHHRQPYNTPERGGSMERKSCLRTSTNYEQHHAPPPYEECTTKSTPIAIKLGAVQAVTAVQPTPAPTWTWSDKKQMHFYVSNDGQLRVFEDGTKEALAPPPRPEAPQWIWDQSRNMWYSRNDAGKCWCYADGSSIPFPENP